jgi:lipoprotein-releasing system permease protein
MRLGPAILVAGRCLLGPPRDGAARRRGGRGERYLRGAVLGVALSLVPLIVVLVVADGMIEGITARYVEVGTYHLQAQPLGSPAAGELQSVAEAARSLRGAASAFIEEQGYGVALAGARTAGAAIRAVDPAFLDDPGVRRYLVAKSGEARLDSSNEILLGYYLARSLGAKVGDAVSLVTERRSRFASGSELAPKVSVFRVRGIVSAGYRELDSLWAFVSLKAGSRILDPGASRTIVGIKVADPYDDLEPFRRSLSAALPDGWAASAWPEVERNVFKSFSTTRALLLLIMALAVAVAAVNVGSAVVMLALERKRDIAILKSAGAGPGFIAAVLCLAGLGTGGLGTLIGLALGCLAAWRVNDLIAGAEFAVNLASRLGSALSSSATAPAAIKLLDPAYYLERIPVHLRPLEIALVGALSIGLCLLAALIPARRAARQSPLDIFRKT